MLWKNEIRLNNSNCNGMRLDRGQPSLLATFTHSACMASWILLPSPDRAFWFFTMIGPSIDPDLTWTGWDLTTKKHSKKRSYSVTLYCHYCLHPSLSLIDQKWHVLVTRWIFEDPQPPGCSSEILTFPSNMCVSSF